MEGVFSGESSNFAEERGLSFFRGIEVRPVLSIGMMIRDWPFRSSDFPGRQKTLLGFDLF